MEDTPDSFVLADCVIEVFNIHYSRFKLISRSKPQKVDIQPACPPLNEKSTKLKTDPDALLGDSDFNTLFSQKR